MKVPLAELIAATGRRKDEYFFRPAVLTASAEIDLTAIYLDIANAWATAVRERILPAYELPQVFDGSATVKDADGAQLQWLINQVEADINRRVIYQTERLGVWVTGAGERQRRATISAVKSATGVDVSGFIRMTDVRDILENSIRENTALITNLSADAKARVERIVFDGFARRRSKRDVTAALAEAMGITLTSDSGDKVLVHIRSGLKRGSVDRAIERIGHIDTSSVQTVQRIVASDLILMPEVIVNNALSAPLGPIDRDTSTILMIVLHVRSIIERAHISLGLEQHVR